MTRAVTVYVPRETAAVSVGAHELALRLAEIDDVNVVRNGSRGMSWLEPLIEVDVDEQRIAYGPVTTGDIDGLLAADFLSGGEHELKHGPVEKIPYLERQERWTFRRCGVIDPLSVADYRQHGGFDGWKKH